MTDMVFLATDDGVFALQNGRAERLGLADKSVSAVIRQPDDQNVLHAGVWGDGVYRSTDGGRNWERALEADVWTLCQRSDRAELLYAGVEPAGVYRSSDSGKSWVELRAIYDLPTYKNWWFPPPPHIAHVTSFVMHPRDVKTIYAGVEVGGVIVSRDGGRTWEELHNGLHDDIHWMAHGGGSSVFILYAATAAGFYRSDDGGAVWRRSGAGIDRRYAYCVARVAGVAERLVMCVSSDSDADDSVLFRSDDGGAHWAKAMDGLPSSAVDGRMKVAAHPERDGVCYVSLPDGIILQSDDAGAHWREAARGLPYVNSLSVV